MGFIEKEVRQKLKLPFLNFKKRSESPSTVVVMPSQLQELIDDGYTKLSDNPEIRSAVDRIANLVSNMSIHLMQNGELGDTRVNDPLSRLVDIRPNQYMTRKSFIYWIVRTLLLEGNGNCVVKPITMGGRVVSLQPIQPNRVTFDCGQDDYMINIDGNKYDPSTLLHFRINNRVNYPYLGDGYQVSLKTLADNLNQSYQTKRNFMRSEYQPTLIVSVDSDADDLATEEGRTKFETQYLKRSKSGQPWIIPQGLVNVTQTKPLTLNDIAINDSVNIDKKTVASLLGVPPFLLGVGEYKKEEYNSFINTKIMDIAIAIQQTLTTLVSDETMYFAFNPRSLYNYSITELVQAGTQLIQTNTARRNEIRGWLNLPPDEEMQELIVLENYIKQSDIGNQSKLIKGGEANEEVSDTVT